MQEPVISIKNLRKRFNLEAGFFARFGRFVHAVNGVSLDIGRNETYGLVGESGCGKTTTARLLVRMYEADEGEILFREKAAQTNDPDTDTRICDVRKLKGRDLRHYREKVKYVFQDPARSLNPRMTVYDVLTSGARWSSKKRESGILSNKASLNKTLFNKVPLTTALLREEAASLIEEVGLQKADLDRRPAEFSGGQRQRISIARGLLMKPDLLICDEVVSALDVSIQGQILNLLHDIREHREISFLFIAHDLKVACYFCDRIGVMYRGEIMEEAPAADLWKEQLHPYTELLFSSVGGTTPSSVPSSSVTANERMIATDKPQPETGCAFASRCPYVQDRCYREKPELKPAGENHLVRCWRLHERKEN